MASEKIPMLIVGREGWMPTKVRIDEKTLSTSKVYHILFHFLQNLERFLYAALLRLFRGAKSFEIHLEQMGHEEINI